MGIVACDDAEVERIGFSMDQQHGEFNLADKIPTNRDMQRRALTGR
jgi:hypothetical protein